MDKQKITDKIMEIARRVTETNDHAVAFRLAGRLEVLFEQLDALPVETPAKPSMMICSGAAECKWSGSCDHLARHEHTRLCENECCVANVGGVKNAICIPVEEVHA